MPKIVFCFGKKIKLNKQNCCTTNYKHFMEIAPALPCSSFDPLPFMAKLFLNGFQAKYRTTKICWIKFQVFFRRVLTTNNRC